MSKETYICQKRPAFVIRQTYILCIPPKNEEIALQTPRTEFLPQKSNRYKNQITYITGRIDLVEYACTVEFLNEND